MSEWLTIECERALYVDRGRDVILCDRLPSPVTLVVKLASADTHPKGGDAKQQVPAISTIQPTGNRFPLRPHRETDGVMMYLGPDPALALRAKPCCTVLALRASIRGRAK